MLRGYTEVFAMRPWKGATKGMVGSPPGFGDAWADYRGPKQ